MGKTRHHKLQIKGTGNLNEQSDERNEDHGRQNCQSAGAILDAVLENGRILPLANIFAFIRVVAAVILSVAKLISSNASEVISIVFVVGAWVQQVGAFLFFNGDSFCSFDAEFSAAGIRAAVLIGGAVRRFLALDPAKHALV